LQLSSLLKPFAAVLVAGVTAGSCLITYYMNQLDRGVAQNIRAAQALVEAQLAIKDRNGALSDLVETTDRIGLGMERLIGHSQQIQRQVQGMSAANRATLELNLALEGSNAVTPIQLRRVLTSLRNMNTSAGSIRDYMSDLRDTASLGVDRLEAISTITARMNTRTPGW